MISGMHGQVRLFNPLFFGREVYPNFAQSMFSLRAYSLCIFFFQSYEVNKENNIFPFIMRVKENNVWLF